MFSKSKVRSSSLFLTELILAILFFSIANAVCVQFFVKSHILSKKSHALNQAVNECSVIAEISRSSSDLDDTLTQLQDLFPDSDSMSDEALNGYSLSEADVILYYDQDFTSCPEDEHAYELRVHFTEADLMLTADMDVTASDGDSIYSLQTTNHLPRRVAHED